MAKNAAIKAALIATAMVFAALVSALCIPAPDAAKADNPVSMPTPEINGLQAQEGGIFASSEYFQMNSFVIPMDGHQNDPVKTFGLVHALLRNGTTVYRAVEPLPAPISGNIVVKTVSYPSGAEQAAGPFFVQYNDTATLNSVKAYFPTVTVDALSEGISFPAEKLTAPPRILVIDGVYGKIGDTLADLGVPCDLTQNFSASNCAMVYNYDVVVDDCGSYYTTDPTIVSTITSFVDSGKSVLFSDLSQGNIANYPWASKVTIVSGAAADVVVPSTLHQSAEGYGQCADGLQIPVWTMYGSSLAAQPIAADVKVTLDVANYQNTSGYRALAYYFHWGNSSGTVIGQTFHCFEQTYVKTNSTQTYKHACSLLGNSLFIPVVASLNAPNTPSQPSGPVIGVVNQSLAYSTSATDPDGDQIVYEWDWDGDGLADESSSSMASGATDYRWHTYFAAGEYGISVRAKDVPGGLYSPWTPPLVVNITVPSGSPPSVTVVSPNGGEIFQAGAKTTVEWSTSGGTAPLEINIDFSWLGTNGPWDTITYGIADTGSYQITVPFSQSSNCYIRVGVQDSQSHVASDKSDFAFTIMSISGTGVPRLEPQKWITPTAIMQNGAGSPDSAQVTLRVDALGSIDWFSTPVDVVLAIDSTGSMSEYGGPAGNKLYYAQQAAKNFLDRLQITPDEKTSDRAALVQFDTTLVPPVKMLSGYTNDIAALKTLIDGIQPGGATPFYDAVGFCVDYANLNHYPPNQTHPHNGTATGHHSPAVIVLTDGIDTGSSEYDMILLLDLVGNSYNSPPPSQYKGYGTRVYTVGLGSNTTVDTEGMKTLAEAGGGSFYHALTGADLDSIYQAIPIYSVDTTVATVANGDYIVKDVLPPGIDYLPGSYAVTANNTAATGDAVLQPGPGDAWEVCVVIYQMNLGQTLEITYSVKCGQTGWQSVGVTSANASALGSDFCRVKYGNYRYATTGDPADIWTNETPEKSIEVLGPGGLPSITVSYPVQASWLVCGHTYNITWAAQNGAGNLSIDLEYKTSAAGAYLPIASALANTGTYAWTAPDIPSTWNCYLRATANDMAGHTASDENGNFTIYNDGTGPAPLTVTITYPNGGENITAGSGALISWGVAGATSPYTCDLYYSPSGTGSIPAAIALGVDNNSYLWPVPGITSTYDAYVYVMVIESGNSTASDWSDGNFTIWNPAKPPLPRESIITISSPANQTSVSGIVNIAVAVQDRDMQVRGARLIVDGAQGGQDASAPFSFQWDTRSAIDGWHYVWVEGYYDASFAGNHTDSGVIMLEVKNGQNATPMLASISVTPASAALLPGQKQAFAAQALDQNGNAMSGATYVWQTGSAAVCTLTNATSQTATAVAQGYGNTTVSVTATIGNITKAASASVHVGSVAEVLYSITGTVKDSAERAVPGALVFLLQNGSEVLNATTGANGTFALSGARAGVAYSITVTAKGYKPYTNSSVASAGADLALSIVLEREDDRAESGAFPAQMAIVGILIGLAIAGLLLAFIPAFYTRIRKEDVLDHFIRGQVYDQIRTNPGSHFNELKGRLHVSHGTLAYHIRTLEMQGFIKSKRDGMYRRFYEMNSKPGKTDGIRYSKLQKSIIDAVTKEPGATQADISRSLSVPSSVVNYNVQQLIKAGVIRVEVDGRRQRCFIAEKGDEAAAS